MADIVFPAISALTAMANWKFIATEFVEAGGESGERLVWEKVKAALKNTGDGIGILNYSDFNHHDQKRYQADILLASRDWGMVVVEVKTCSIDSIVQVQASRWEMRHFYKRYIDPFKQAENQLWSILGRCNKQKALKNEVSGRAIVALPLITRDEWRSKGFEDDHHTCPPIIFADELGVVSIRNCLESRATILERGRSPHLLSDQQWKLLKNIILGNPKVADIQREENSNLYNSLSSASNSSYKESNNGSISQVSAPVVQSCRSHALKSFRDWMSEADLEQARIGMQIPPGPQRIRGIAGSGKTLLLCQKAARMHIQHPEWDIALIFFTRSLYELIPNTVRQWVEYWSDGEMTPDLENGKLKVMHAWGARDRPGLYSLLRNRANVSASVSSRPTGSIPERLAASCRRLLTTAHVEPMFDAILIDEGQDLVVDNEWRYEDKQAIYWLAWKALRPINSSDPNLRRLIWAYDEAQSLDSLGVPSYGAVFGNELGGVLSGQTTGPTYKGGISKSEVMRLSYPWPNFGCSSRHWHGAITHRRHAQWLHDKKRLGQNWI